VETLRRRGTIPTGIKVLMGQSIPDVLEVRYTHDYARHLRQCVSRLEEYCEEAVWLRGCGSCCE